MLLFSNDGSQFGFPNTSTANWLCEPRKFPASASILLTIGPAVAIMVRMKVHSFPLGMTAVVLITFFFGKAIAASYVVDFNRDIRPILSAHCYACHGPDEEAREAELRLDTADGAVVDLGGHAAIKPGQPDQSEMIARIESTDPDLVMPPPEGGHPLNDQQKQLLRQWIAEGAQYDLHWSFISPKKAALPQIQTKEWARHPIDHFVLHSLDAAGLTPAVEADRYQWLRRVSLDLTGLPPTVQEADTFAADTGDDAFEKVVDRLLDNEAFGEKWARMWLDLARYADTKGYEKDNPRQMWKFREWVINAINDDMPFDKFTIEQLAGDLLPEPSSEQLIATAFHRNTMTNDEGGTDNEEFRVAAVKDRVDTTIQVWMGLTMGCAKCHSHKYDPIQQRDYYAFYALFNQTEDADRGDDAPTLAVPSDEQAAEIAQLDSELKPLEQKLKSDSENESFKEQIAALQKRLGDIRKQLTKTPIMRELSAEKQRQTKIHNRGSFLDQGASVKPAVLNLFGQLPSDAELNRLGVAKWLLHDDNPLTARVTVNRIWARLFGAGIVETEEDFGTQGLPPTHPELLDWLAVDFRDNDWSLKQLLKSIVLSATYRQSSVVTQEKLQADPRNSLLSRGPRFRLSAEAVRDQALAASGLLTMKIGGPSVMPPQPDGVWKSTYSGLNWKNAEGPDRYRRGLYTYWKRTSPYPSMTTFDAGSGEVCQIRRVRTNTPLQALVTLNDPSFVEAAGALSGLMNEVPGTIEQRIAYGFRRILTRMPTAEETSRLVSLYQTLKSDFENDTDAAVALAEAANTPNGDAAMISVANVLLNLDDTLMKP
jgi:hypothetical protein